MSEAFLTGKWLQRFEVLQERLVPRAARFTPEQREQSRALVNTIAATQPARNRKKLALFLALIDGLAVRYGRLSFAALPPSKQDRLLIFLFDGPIGVFRKGFWALNTLAKLGVYGQTDLYDEIGYRLRENPLD